MTRPHQPHERQLRVLISADKFKGTLSAHAATRAIARGWLKARPHDKVRLLPLSDGGDGFGEVISELVGAERKWTATCDAAHRPCTVSWWLQKTKKLAVIESARIVGLAMLPPKQFHPFRLDTFGMGRVLKAAAAKGARRCLVGIGGSATNDAGFGLARAMGWQFLDQAKKEIECWPELNRLERIRSPRYWHRFGELIVAVDVRNPLLGPRGATRIYGPQKGLLPAQFRTAERSLERLAKVWKKQYGRELSHEPGAGAAGGLGFGLRAFLKARLEPGFELFADYADLERRLDSADLVITGEGAVDKSTLMGKGVGQLAQRCLQRNIPCLALAGRISNRRLLHGSFRDARALTEIVPEIEAKTNAAHWLEKLAREVGEKW